MKILVLLSRVPYPTEKGDKLRAFHQIRCLSAKHEVVLFCLSEGKAHPEALSVLGQYCSDIYIFRTTRLGMLWNVFKAILKGIPLQAGYFYRCKARKAFQDYIIRQKPDHVYCQLLRVAEYVKHIDIPKTLDYQDVFSMGVKRRMAGVCWILKPFFMLEYRRLLRYERKIFSWFNHTTIISEPDRDLISHPGKAEIRVVPNGVDQQYFTPLTREKTYDIVFTGNMGYPPNINAAEYLALEILPLVKKHLPQARLLIAGAAPHSRVVALKGKDITVTGWVPDIRESYAGSRVFVAPMRIGTGLQNKLLEAMSMKLPCITSPLANSALKAREGTEILVGNTASDFAAHIVTLLTQPETASQLALAGNQFVKENYSWEGSTQHLISLIESS